MKIPVTILAATGVIGQTYVSLLANHPWFTIHSLVASKAHDTYEEAVKDTWHLCHPIPKGYRLDSLESFKPSPLIFSALPDLLAQKYEPKLALEGSYVISSAAVHRNTAPLIIPEINPHHLGKSKLISKPNCTIQSFLLPLAPLHKKAKIRALHITTLQAISGSGRLGLSMHTHDNVIPFIEGEEEKIEREPLKILDANFPISAHANRVAVLHGHLACVSVSFEQPLLYEEIMELWETPSPLNLPSCPKYPIIYHENPNRPQSRLDRDAGGGMSVSVGRLRPCPLLDWRFVCLSHNTIRGGAGTGVLIAELLKKEGYLG